MTSSPCTGLPPEGRRRRVVVEAEPTVAVQLSLPKSVLRRLDTLAEQSGKDRNGVIVQLVEASKPLALADVVAAPAGRIAWPLGAEQSGECNWKKKPTHEETPWRAAGVNPPV